MIASALFKRDGRASKTERMNLMIIPRGRAVSADSLEDDSSESWLSYMVPRKPGRKRTRTLDLSGKLAQRGLDTERFLDEGLAAGGGASGLEVSAADRARMPGAFESAPASRDPFDLDEPSRDALDAPRTPKPHAAPAGAAGALFIATEGDVSQEASGTIVRASGTLRDPGELARMAIARAVRVERRVVRFSEQHPTLLLGMVCTALALSFAWFIAVFLGL